MIRMNAKVNLYQGDCLEVMKNFEDNSIDTVITDPPYGLKFMGKKWDYEIPSIEVFAEMLRVAKPGAVLLCFGGTRTFHRIACNIEDGGWIIRDTVMWVYGSGLPKSQDISKAIDKAAGAEREVVGENVNWRDVTYHKTNTYGGGAGINARSDNITAPATDAAKKWDGWGTGLKPAWEPIIVAMKPLEGTFAENALKWGVAGLWIEGGQVKSKIKDQKAKFGGEEAGLFEGVEEKKGNPPAERWPANVIHDGSEEVMAEFERAGERPSGGYPTEGGQRSRVSTYGEPNERGPQRFSGGSGSAARFFYCAKASKEERNRGLAGREKKFLATMGNGIGKREHNPKESNAYVQNHHPTVKPVALMEYLCKLTAAPTGGVVLDPYMGSGSTGIAALKTGRQFIGIENDPEYFEIAKRRIAEVQREDAFLEGKL